MHIIFNAIILNLQTKCLIQSIPFVLKTEIERNLNPPK